MKFVIITQIIRPNPRVKILFNICWAILHVRKRDEKTAITDIQLLELGTWRDALWAEVASMSSRFDYKCCCQCSWPVVAASMWVGVDLLAN